MEGFTKRGEKGEIKPDEVSLEEYKYAQRVFREKKCQNFGDYTYCFMDTLHLADVFESYRKKTMETFGLDPAHYLTLPSVSNDAMLKVTKAQEELLSDQQMYLFFEEGIRGGVSVAVKRYSKANNVYMGSKYDSGKEIIYILYLDKNALYAGCMTKPLPYHNFRLISKERLAHMEIDDSLIRGCTRDQAFHDYTNCYPLAPEHKVVGGSTKLVPNLLDRRHYIVHYSALQEYLKHGLILKKIHRGVSYEDKDYIRPYIELCTEMRKKAKREFAVSLWKKFPNSAFSKQIENVRARSGVVVVSGEMEKGKKRLRKLVASPTFRSSTIFANSTLVSVNQAKPALLLDKPIKVGQAVLDLSKKEMFEFWYLFAKPMWGDNLRLVASDMDSLVIEIKTCDVYQDIAPHVSTHFDTSNYKDPHPSGIPIGVNKKVPLLMKDELESKPILEFVLLQSKIYAFTYLDGRRKRLREYPRAW